MADPFITPAATGAAISLGLSALLAGWLGQVAAEVMMVILSAIAGSTIALSSQKKTFWDSMKFITSGVLAASVLSWAISSILTTQMPSLSSPYLPTIVAFVLGFAIDKLPRLMETLIDRIFKKAEQ